MYILLSLVSVCSGYSVHSSCTAQDPAWHYGPSVAPRLRSWVLSLVTMQGEGDTQSRLFDPQTGEFTEHFAHVNDEPEKDDDREDVKRRVVTVSRFHEGVPTGLSWQWRSKRVLDGFLYGKVNDEGRFTGDQITFIYPDFLTGLRGTFVNGVLEHATAVDIIGERCVDGIKELKLEASKDVSVTWRKEEANETYIGQHPTVMDPHEKKSVYVDKSFIPRSKEGVFAARKFLPGDLISYFGGLKTFEENFLLPDMTEEEEENAASYYYNLGLNVPAWWGYPQDLVIDTPGRWRELTSYRTTQAHKVNHKFKGANGFFQTVHHPVLGALGCIVAKAEIDVNEEVYVNYEYNLGVAPQWYRDMYEDEQEYQE